MQTPDPNASDAPDQQGKPIGFSRRQLLAGTPLAAFGVAVSGLNLGNVTSSVAAELTEKKNPVDALVDPSRGLVRHSSGSRDEGEDEAKEEELDDFMFDIEKDGKGWTGPGGSAKEASVAEFPLSQSIRNVASADPVQCADLRGNLVNLMAGREPRTASGRSFRVNPGSGIQIS